MERRLLLACLALVLAACTPEPGPPPPSPTSPEPPVEPTCPDSGVRASVGLEEAAMGLRVIGLELTNCGDAPYHLDGYPSLRVLGTEGEQLDVRVQHGAEGIATIESFEVAPEPLTLETGEVAGASIVWRNTDTSGGAQAVGHTVSIAPARGEPWQPVELDDRFPNGLHIDLGTTGTLGVSAWHR